MIFINFFVIETLWCLNIQNFIRSILIPIDGKPPRPLIRKAVGYICKRLEMLSSGHEMCPVPSSVEELLAWWETPPPKD